MFLGACADELEQQTVNEVPTKLQRGITGGGQLIPPDRSDDPDVESRNTDPGQH